MAFFEELFPPCYSIDAVAMPRFVNSVARMPSGRRVSNALSLYPLHDYSIAQPVKTDADFEDLRAFWYVVGGDRDGFRFKDWSDFEAVYAQTGTALLTGTTYQMTRLYVRGARTFTRPIYKPVAGIQIQRNRGGVLTNVTANTTVVLTTGQVTINTGHESGDTYRWQGEFHVPVAFKNPAATWRLLGTSELLTQWNNIELEEFRL